MKHGTVAKYNAGCVCGHCKQANSEYRKELRKRRAEEAAMFATPAANGLRLVQGEAVTSANAPANASYELANEVEAGVQAELDALCEQSRPGLAAAALSLARILDNPRLASTQPAAAAKLMTILNALHGTSGRRHGRLAVVRAMACRDLHP